MKQLKKGEKQKQLSNSIIYIKLSSCCTKNEKNLHGKRNVHINRDTGINIYI